MGKRSLDELIVLRDEMFAHMVKEADSDFGLELGELLRDSIDLEKLMATAKQDYPNITKAFGINA